jgi:Ca2+-binding RTX toxin-like protein
LIAFVTSPALCVFWQELVFLRRLNMARLDGTTQDDQLIWSDAEPVEIYGYAGDDSLRGGQGNDVIYGNTGFVF